MFMDDGLFVLAVMSAALMGMTLERWRAAFRRPRPAVKNAAVGSGPQRFGGGSVKKATDQLEIVMAADFQARRLLSREEARVLYAAERAAKAQGEGWRAMAQVSLGEILRSSDREAFGAINSKRVDILVINRHGAPIAALEYQGSGHYQGSAPARDAVKKEALRKAGVGYIEITAEHDADDIQREIVRAATRKESATTQAR